jgi:hypothetical protein
MSSALSESNDFSTIFRRLRDHWSTGLDAVVTGFAPGFFAAATFVFAVVLFAADCFISVLDFVVAFFVAALLTATFVPLGAAGFFAAVFLVAGLSVPADLAAVFRRTAVFFSEMALILLKPTL